jgi:cytochrome P450
MPQLSGPLGSHTSYVTSQHQVAIFLNEIVFQLYAMANGAPAKRFGIPVISDAASIQKILNEPEHFPKNMRLLAALGRSRFTTNGPDWMLRRNITQKAYASAGASQNAARISEIYASKLTACETTQEAIHRALMSAASIVFFEALGCEIDVEPLLGFFDRAREHVKRLQYFSWNAPTATDVVALREEGTTLVHDFKDEVLSSELSGLMTQFCVRAKNAAGFDPTEELLMNFFAGIETTAATLSFAIDRLGVNASVQDRIRADICQAKSETYLTCFIQETMRYFPAIPFVVREAASNTEIDGLHLAAGQTLILSIVGLHHHPKYWIDPQIFDCSRSEFVNNSYDRRAFIPFLTGPRMCGGARLARLELQEALKAFIRNFSVSGQTDEIGFDYGLALRPRSRTAAVITRLKP